MAKPAHRPAVKVDNAKANAQTSAASTKHAPYAGTGRPRGGEALLHHPHLTRKPK